MHNIHELDNSELRAIIEGRRTYRRCPRCNGLGIEYWIETKYGEKQCSPEYYAKIAQLPIDVQYDENNLQIACCETCTSCEGLQYVIAIHE